MHAQTYDLTSMARALWGERDKAFDCIEICDMVNSWGEESMAVVGMKEIGSALNVGHRGTGICMGYV